LSLLPESRFRGSVVITNQDYSGSLTQASLLRAFIPTLNEYSQFVTQQLFVLLYEQLAKGSQGNSRNRLPLIFGNPTSDPGRVARYMNLTGALGARLIISQSPLDFSSAPTPIVEERRFASGGGFFPRITWHVYELPTTNVAGFGPTKIHQLRTAPEMLERMASLDFDYRTHAVVSEEIGENLLPLGDPHLWFVRGGVRVRATSGGTSLAVLPLQYSHCLRISDPDARLIRVNLAMVGVLFRGSLDAEIGDSFGLLTPGCRAGDKADIERLEISATRVAEPPADRPFAIKTLDAVLPNLMAVWRQVK
jgi:hypothetical protein